MRKGDIKYLIKIRNWHEYQPKMRGTGKRKRMRNWVAVSTDLFRDPDFLELSHTNARLWLGLLCHSGRVGPEFSMTPSRAVSMFALRRPCDFEVLKNHGFIELERVTGQDSTKTETADKTNTQLVSQAAKPKPEKKAAKKKSAAPKKQVVVPDYGDLINEESWAEFVQHRREIKKPITPMSEKKQKNMLKRFTHADQKEMIDLSIANGWRGLFPDKIGGPAKKNPNWNENLAADMRDKGMIE